MFLDVNYSIRESSDADSRTVRLYDGSMPVLSINGILSPAPRFEPRNQSGGFAQNESAALLSERIAPGFKTSGTYRCDASAVSRLRKRWDIPDGQESAISALCWASYLIGMECPGTQALFSQFSFAADPLDAFDGEVCYSVSVEKFDPRLDQVWINVSLSSGGTGFGSGECRSFVRRELAPVDEASIEEFLPASETLSGNTVLVIGASRGFGSGLARGFASQGADVVGTSRSAIAQQDRIRYESGDPGDPRFLAGIASKLPNGRLDYLVCNAFPALLPLRLEPNTVNRIEEYIRSATQLVSAPLAAFMPMLEASGGCVILVSSSAVETAPKDWPHYVAAKMAAEGLVRVAVAQYPKTSCLIVRPGKLLTNMTNTPMGRRGAIRPEEAAARVLQKALQPPPPGEVRISGIS
jgi:NAD(P)-dependent dehydrogenase (short-subunit alcohol dehydrogenase family)